MLRTIPNNTHGSLDYTIDTEDFPSIKVDGHEVIEYPQKYQLNGVLQCHSITKQKIYVSRTSYPSTDHPAFFEKVVLKNKSDKTAEIEIPHIDIVDTTNAAKGVDGSYVISITSNPKGSVSLQAGDSMTYTIVYSARQLEDQLSFLSPEYELSKRRQFVQQTFGALSLHTPDESINRIFDFAKLRAVESIYATKGGLMHGPGGGRYYAAIWANDQAEYANPFFPFLGNLAGNESAINSFRHFARFMNDEYKPIPSSIVAEGLDFWNGAGDRGDMAMIAYGASRFCLAYGDPETSRQIWPLIQWCLEYCHRKLNKKGVVESDCDELENRFPAGDANLNTSALYYDALVSSGYLGKALGMDDKEMNTYSQQAKKLRAAIENHFGATVAGYETYRYFEGNETLRAWICTPLTVGIFDRSETTIDALFSEQLWTSDGLATEAGQITFWDRATLYALRGVFAAGATEKAIEYLKYYSKRRLLGEHVPYPVEAYPEGNQRHLSAESALYCRVITEGLFGIRPVGFDSFEMTPRLPKSWDHMALRSINAFGKSFDILIDRLEDKLKIQIVEGNENVFTQVISNHETTIVSIP